MDDMLKFLKPAAIGGIIAVLSTFASAHERYFTFTYDWFTPARFERELELHWIHSEGGAARGQIELEYGVTDRYVVSPYVLFEKEGNTLRSKGWKVEQRYRFGEFALKKLLPAAYIEVEKENDEPYKLEGKLIGSYLPSPGVIFSANLILEKELKSGEDVEAGYAVGAAKRLGSNFHVGVEAFGDWTHNRHFIGPVIGFGDSKQLKFLATAAIPFAGGGPKQLRILLEKEF
jgi:hypothetical protein